MSKKLYKVIKAVDLLEKDGPFRPFPNRYLVFKNLDSGNQIKVFFPKEYTTIILDGKLYDWYGNEVELGPDIAEVLRQGSYVKNNGDTETFWVKFKNGRKGFVKLGHICPQKLTDQLSSQNIAKIRFTSRWIDGKAFLISPSTSHYVIW